MAFLLPVGELILEGVEAGVAGNMVNAVYNEFKEPAKKWISNEAGNVIGDYAKNNPNGIVDMTLDKASNHRKRRGRPPRKVG